MKRTAVFVCFLFLLLSAAGCNMPQKSADLPAAEPTSIPTEEIILSVDEPTATPVPREKLVLITDTAAPAVSAALENALSEVCGTELDCETLASSDNLPEDADDLVFAFPPSDPAALRERFPEARLITVSDTAVEGMWTLRYNEDFLPFIAGTALSSNSYDWRGAALLPSDTDFWGGRAEETFVNGAQYFCGNCRGQLAPYVDFPLMVLEPGTSGPDVWMAGFDTAQQSFINTVFLSEEAVSEELLQKLVSLNVMMMGSGEMPAGMEANWIASVNYDWAGTLTQVLEAAGAGQTEGLHPLELLITPGQLTDSFSSGKALLLQDAYEKLLSGELSPYDPTQEYSEASQ